MAKLQSKYKQEGDTYLLELKLNEIRQLFNSSDPAPFWEKDLDDDAENYIVEAVSEFSFKANLKLVFYLPQAVQDEAKRLLPEAIHHYFDYKRQNAQRELHSTLRLGRACLVVGLLFLFFCISMSELVGQLGDGTLVRMFHEGLIISGWVAMWRPLEIFLYDWWPIYHNQKVFEKLSQIAIELRFSPEQEAANTSFSTMDFKSVSEVRLS